MIAQTRYKLEEISREELNSKMKLKLQINLMLQVKIKDLNFSEYKRSR